MAETFAKKMAAHGMLGGVPGAYLTNPKFKKGVDRFLFGKPEKMMEFSTLTEEQQPLFQQMLASLQGEGAGGAFGTAADYYRNLLSDNPAALEAFAAPEMRRFNEQIIPDLAEQFAGLGAGSLSSSGFQRSLGRAGADLFERIAAIRAGLGMQGAQGLSQLGQFGLGQFKENVLRPRQPGALEMVLPIAGKVAASAATGGMM